VGPIFQSKKVLFTTNLLLAVFEMKILLMAFVRAFEFEVVEPIETRMSATIQPRVISRPEDGACLPLRLRPISPIVVA
jgi:hypothetical protein